LISWFGNIHFGKVTSDMSKEKQGGSLANSGRRKMAARSML